MFDNIIKLWALQLCEKYPEICDSYCLIFSALPWTTSPGFSFAFLLYLFLSLILYFEDRRISFGLHPEVAVYHGEILAAGNEAVCAVASTFGKQKEEAGAQLAESTW